MLIAIHALDLRKQALASVAKVLCGQLGACSSEESAGNCAFQPEGLGDVLLDSFCFSLSPLTKGERDAGGESLAALLLI